jgi:peptide deformylase
MLDIITIGDEVLREKAERITSFGSELKVLVDAMIESMRSERGLGLAAPQVGVSKRLFVVELPDEDAPRVFVNPEIIETSLEQSSYEEGCLSIPGVYEEVIRPVAVTLQAQDVSGKPFTVQAQGMLARVVQHEYDHLQGVLFVDRLPQDKRDRALSLYEKKAKNRKGQKRRARGSL